MQHGQPQVSPQDQPGVVLQNHVLYQQKRDQPREYEPIPCHIKVTVLLREPFTQPVMYGSP